jgi:hypothetical protein
MRWKQFLLVGLTVTALALTFYAISAAYGIDTIQTEEGVRAQPMDRTETNVRPPRAANHTAGISATTLPL